MQKFLSIIIPVYNEAGNVGPLLDFLLEHSPQDQVEIIVVDGGSTDFTCREVHERPVLCYKSPKASRAVQMNYGAEKASGQHLYFVHADTVPPKDFFPFLQKAANEKVELACFRFKFVSKSLILAVNSYCTRFDVQWCRGGDQTLFVSRNLFEKLNGYDEYYSIMEEYDFLNRAEKVTKLHILPRSVKVSARKYNNNSWLRVQLVNLRAFRQFRKGVHPDIIKKIYKSALNPY